MTWVVPLALGGLAVLVMAVFTMLSARKHHHAMVAPATTVGPRILVHDINDDRCTGCDACVAVCPTNVLDLVANKSRVLRFQDCIQCEACMFACPTEALVMFPEGATPPPLKVPEIDENFQTAVPGQYLIGEVAGKPLVKNAANLGRAVVEHMLATGLRAGALGNDGVTFDVAIIGSGPGGLSAALSCIQRGLSYVVLEKEQQIASTIARYPKGKLVMAEPYDTANISLLPVFDSAKEQLIPIWKELIERVGVQIRQGESVETVKKGGDGAFEVRSTVGTYRAQRVVMSIGTRGKPRTLQVPGENLPKVFSLLEDPDEWRGRSVLVVGGGDSACEAALALADAGAKVMISYRGKGFNRAAPKNKSTIEQYAHEGRIKAKLGSQVLNFEPDSVTLALGDGSQKRYANDAAFVLIGADPPVAWLEKMGIRFVERPHQYQMGKSDDIVRRFVPRAIDCPEDAARAAAQVLGGSTGIAPSAPADAVSLPMPMGDLPVSGPRKWLRSATSIFSNKQHTPAPSRLGTNPGGGRVPPPPGPKKKFDAPVPLSEFAKRGRSQDGTGVGINNAHVHTGHGRRDQLSAGERTRILRMLRDEGGRLADEDSQVYIGAAPGKGRDYDFDFEDDSPANPPPPAPSMMRPDVPAKPAVVVGLAQAQALKGRSKKPSIAPPPPSAPPPVPVRARNDSRAPLRRPVPAPFGDEATRQVDDDVLESLRRHDEAQAQNPMPEGPRKQAPTFLPSGKTPPRPVPPPSKVQFEEPTRMADMDPRAFDEAHRDSEPGTEIDGPRRFLANVTPSTDPGLPGGEFGNDDATRMQNIEGIAAMERARKGNVQQPPQEERTRAVNIRSDKSISDIDWDLD
ncbi:MAG: NAD(P)-binding domain-containing protein [Myxococcales bacterium]|nr:NAD(P)-binding domain-containing protein [Myxococcales bacterium]